MQEPPGIIQDLTKQLFRSFRNKVKHQPQRAREATATAPPEH